jgi:tetratricopeptide (TPR) repeat protein
MMHLRSIQYVSIGIAVVLAGALFLVPVAYRAHAPVPHHEPPAGLNDFLLGDYYFNHGPYADGTYDLAAARAHYEAALAAQPTGDSAAWYQLGRIDFLEGKFTEALHKFDLQLAYFGDDQFPNVYYMRGLSYAYRAKYEGNHDDWSRAETAFKTFLTHEPESPWGAVDLSWTYFMQGKYEEMKTLLVAAATDHPDNPWVLNMYGLALLNTGDTAQAREVLARAKNYAAALTIEDWSRSYPGNDPAVWGQGLEEFRATIDKNISAAQ